MIIELEFTNEGCKYLIMTIDCFTRWLEIWPLIMKSSEEVGDWLRRHLLLCFGKPHWVHVDARKKVEAIFA